MLDADPEDETVSYRSRPLNRSSLGDALYPTAKTYDQQESEYAERSKAKRLKYPKYPHLRVALYGSTLSILVGSFVTSVGKLMMSGSIPLIFMSFGMAIALTFMSITYVRFISDTFDKLGGGKVIFSSIYIPTIVVLPTTLLIDWPSNIPKGQKLYALGIVHFILALLYLAPLLKRRLVAHTD